MDGSFEQVFLEEHAYVYRTLLRLGVPHRDVEDAMQEVFLAVHGKWTHIDRDLPKRPWLFAFAHRHAANYRRLRRHQRDWNAEPDRFASSDDPESATQAQEERALVLAALEALPDDRRAVFVACELDGLPVLEIASALAIPIGTVHSRLRTARAEFTHAARRIMAQRGDGR